MDAHKFGHPGVVQIEREYLVSNIGSNLTVEQISHWHTVLLQPAQVCFTERDLDNYWNLGYDMLNKRAFINLI